MENILKALDEKLRDMELTIACKDYDIKNLKDELARAEDKIKRQQEDLFKYEQTIIYQGRVIDNLEPGTAGEEESTC